MAYLDSTGLAQQVQYIKAYVNNCITQQATTGTAAKATADANGNNIANTYATKTYANTAAANAVAGLVNSAPATLDTLNELAAALGNDPNFATTVTTQLNGKLSANSANYIKSASVSNNTLTLTKGDNTTLTFTGGTTYTASDGIELDGTNFSNSGVRVVVESSTNGSVSVNTAGTTEDIVVYTHPTTAGNKHIPSGGSSGQFLKYSAAGTAAWNSIVGTDVKLTGYSKPNTTSAIAATDTANAAFGKLEKKFDSYFLKSGGTITGDVRLNDYKFSNNMIDGGLSIGFDSSVASMGTYGASLSLYTDFSLVDTGGSFKLIADNGTSSTALIGNPGGNLTWGGTAVSLSNHTHSAFTKSGSSAAAGFVPKPATTAGTTKFLCEDATWKVPATFVKSGSSAAAGYVPKPATTAGTTKFLCEDATWKVPYSNFVESGSTAAAGLVPSPGTTAGTTKFLCEDATWKVPSYDAILASPAFTGTPTAPTAAAGTNTTQIATTAFVQSAVSSLVNSAPAALDTLAELSAALGNDPNFATTIATQIGNKADADHTHNYAGSASAGGPATSIAIEAGTTNTARYVWFSYSGTGNEGKACYDADFKYNPSTNNLTVTKINGVAVGSTPAFTDTTYDAMTASEATTGTATTARSITAKVLNDKIAEMRANNNRTIEFIRSTSAAGAAITGVTEDDALYDGKTIFLFLTNAAGSDATLNLTLADGTTTTGAKPIYYTGTTRMGTTYAAGSVVSLTYLAAEDAWRRADYNTNTNTYDKNQHANAIKAETAITKSAIIVGTSAGYKNAVAGATFDISYPILFASAAIAATKTATTTYDMYPSVALTVNKSGWTGTTYSMAYLVGTLSGNTFTIDTDVFTTTIPSTEDGKAYIPIGVCSSTTAVYFFPSKVCYEYKDGAFRPYDSTTALTVSEIEDIADDIFEVIIAVPS